MQTYSDLSVDVSLKAREENVPAMAADHQIYVMDFLFKSVTKVSN